MTEAGLDYRRPRLLFFTHTHIDHTGDLAPLLFALKNTPNLPEDFGLTIFGPAGFKAYINALRSAQEPWLSDLPFRLEVQELANEMVSFGTWRVIARTVRHSRSALGFRVELEGHAVAISGDTDYCPAVVELCRESNLAVLECSLPDEQKVNGHLTPTFAAQIAQEAGCRKIVLIHLYPQCDEIDVVAICKKAFTGEVVVAEDLMSFSI